MLIQSFDFVQILSNYYAIFLHKSKKYPEIIIARAFTI
nr:MAG TPA: hypothetical protein [Inoviridae sp.]